MSSTTSRRLAVQRLLAGFLCGLIGLLAFARWGFWAEMVGCVSGFYLGTILPRLLSVRINPRFWSSRHVREELASMRASEGFLGIVNMTILGLWTLASSLAIILVGTMLERSGSTVISYAFITFACLATGVMLFMFFVLTAVRPTPLQISDENERKMQDMFDRRLQRFRSHPVASYMLDQYNRMFWAACGIHTMLGGLTLVYLYRALFMWRTLHIMTTFVYFKAMRRLRQWTESFVVSAVAAIVTTIASGYILRPHFATLTVGVCALVVGMVVGATSYTAPIAMRRLLHADDHEEEEALRLCRGIISTSWAHSLVSIKRLVPFDAIERAWRRWFPNMDHALNLL